MSKPSETIQRYVEAFNAGDIDAMTAEFGPDGAILDGMAPHTWLGPLRQG